MSTFKSNNKYPSIPTIGQDIKSHTAALNAIAEAIAIHERRTKDLDNSFVRVKELVDLGLITLVGGDFNVIGVDLGSIADVGDLTGASESDFLRFRSGVWVNDQLDAGDILQSFVTQHEAALTILPTQITGFDEAAQDAVGGIVASTTSITLTYSDATPSISAAIVDEYVQDLVGAMLVDSATIDFTYNDGAGTFTGIVIDNSITDAKLRQSAGVSVVGRSANSTGNVADITAGSNDTVLRRVSNALDFGQLTVGMFPNDVVTYAKIQNVSATSRVLGRVTSGAGDIEELTLSQVLDFVGSAANGDILYRSGGAWTRLGIGTNTHVLTVSSGLPVWAAASGGGSPGGSDTQLQYNNASAFGGISGATYNSGSDTLAFSHSSFTVSTGSGTLSFSSNSGAASLDLDGNFFPGPRIMMNAPFGLIELNTERTTFNGNAEVDADSTAGNTRLLVWDVDNSALVRVSVGANDSGGTGFKVLCIPN